MKEVNWENRIKRQKFIRGHSFDFFASAATLRLGVACCCSSSNHLAIGNYFDPSTLFLQSWNTWLNHADSPTPKLLAIQCQNVVIENLRSSPPSVGVAGIRTNGLMTVIPH
jgi:hypothetical protein